MKTGRGIRWLAAASTAMIFIVLTTTGEAALGFGKKSETFTPSAPGEPYFVDGRGNMKPVLQPVERNSDKDWMGLHFTDYSGPRMRVAVMKVENKTATAAAANETAAEVMTQRAAEVPVASIEDLLSTAMDHANRFELVDRREIEKTLSEQDLGASGRAKKSTVVKTGQIHGADYLIYASINEYTPVKNHTGGGGGGKFGGLIKVNRDVSEVAMSFRVVDATTSAQIFNTTTRATWEHLGLDLGGFGSTGGGAVTTQNAPPINYAVQSCINKGVYELVTKLKARPWSGAVVKVEEQHVYINAGTNAGLTAGEELVAIGQGKELFDPVTGESLGQETTVIGILRVTDVKEKFSIAEITEGCKGLKTGDRVELRNSPPIVVTSKP
ncbi:MAG TPA: CsgG/HfaB family protein [Thermoanaerobaculia bacterium]|jgi:curli biogenesis system outer membrane secretion channel CsgG